MGIAKLHLDSHCHVGSLKNSCFQIGDLVTKDADSPQMMADNRGKKAQHMS